MKLNTIENFFAYAFTQAETIEQRIALYFVKEGYILPSHLEKLTWKDVDLENNRFWSVNYLGKFLVPMTSEFRQELKSYSLHEKEHAPIFKEIDELHSLIQKLTIVLDGNPNVLEQFNELFIELPSSYRKSFIPPKELIQRISGNVSYQSFQHGGFSLTQIISKKLQQYSNHKEEQFLDWGCGCGRTGIHFINNKSITYTGCDIDEECIDWCKSNLSENRFYVNNFDPPLPFNDSKFTVVFATSVMTHLDENSQQKWLKEIHRVLKPNGLLLATTLGEQSANILGEKEQLTKTGYIERTSNVLDGIAPKDRYKNTFQTKAYTYENWTCYFDILEYQEQAIGHQDLVTMRKKRI